MVKRLLLAAILALVGPRWAFAGDIVVSNFAGGLDTLDTPAELDPSFAQDLLNVNFQPGGGAVFKRDGYGLFQSLPISCSTCAVHGGLHFQQVSGNDVQLWGNDVQLSGSVNDAAFVNLATGTVGATWQCADSQGSAYCLTSSRDTPVKTDGSIANTSYQSGIPLGTMATFSPTQLIVAGVTGNENTIYVSQQNAFTTFTIGVLPSSAFTEPIASPGSRITHLAYYFGKLFWWKDQSFGYATFTNQNDWQLTIVSNQIGTLDNSDAFWNSSGFDSGSKFTGTAQANAGQSPGGIFFRGQDNHFYVYDGYYLTRISRPITPTVTASNRRKANAWTQTSQSDWQAGAFAPTANFSTTISVGDVQLSSFSRSDQTLITSPTYNSVNVDNNSFESGFTNWTAAGAGPPTIVTTANGTCGTISAEDGTNFVSAGLLTTPTLKLLTYPGGSLISSVSQTASNCVWTVDFLTVPASFIGTSARLVITDGLNYTLTSDPFVLNGNAASLWVTKVNHPTSSNYYFDNVISLPRASRGYSTSGVFDSGFSSTTALLQSVSNTSVAPNFSLQTSVNGTSGWTQITTSSGTSAAGQRYFRYLSTYTLTGSDAITSVLSAQTVVAVSTGGIFSSAVHNAPSLGAWDTFIVNDQTDGGSIAYFTRSSTSAFTATSATPAWVSQTKNSTVAASTGTFFQARAVFTSASASLPLALNSFQFNWFEGSASDKAYMTYFNDAIWFSVSSSSNSATNNRVFYWDILNGGWSIYDIAANGFQIENNSLYFGDPVQGRIFKYGGVTTDNGLSINSYWRSKSFYAPSTINPYSPPSFEEAFNQKSFIQADFILGESSTTLAYTYTIDSKTPTTVNFTAYDAAASLIQRNFYLAPGKIGKYYDFKIGDNSSAQAWRMMGHRVKYNAEAWRPVTN